MIPLRSLSGPSHQLPPGDAPASALQDHSVASGILLEYESGHVTPLPKTFPNGPMLEWKLKSLLWLMLSPASCPPAFLLPLTSPPAPLTHAAPATLLLRAFAQALPSAWNVLPNLCPVYSLSPCRSLLQGHLLSEPASATLFKIQPSLPALLSARAFSPQSLATGISAFTSFLEYKLQEGKDVCAFCSLSNSQHLDRCLVHHRPSINI